MRLISAVFRGLGGLTATGNLGGEARATAEDDAVCIPWYVLLGRHSLGGWKWVKLKS